MAHMHLNFGPYPAEPEKTCARGISGLASAG